MRSNVKLFYIYISLNRLEMWLPVTALFLLDRGYSLSQYTIVDAVWYISTLIFEVPTGVVTDRCGKKISLLIAGLFQALSLFILAWGRSFLSVLVSYVMWGFATSFETGTHDALIYDSLREIGRQGDYQGVMSRIRTLTILAGALGSVAAGYLGAIDLALPIALTAIIALLTTPLVLFFTEPQVSDVREPSHLLHVRASVRYVSRHRLVALLILYMAVVATTVWGLHDFYQAFLRSFNIQVKTTGLLYFLFRLFGVAGAYLSVPVYTFLGRTTVYLIPLFFVATVLGMGFFVAPWTIVFIFFIYFLEGFHYPILNALLNRNLPPGKRATIISLGSVLACLMGALLYPALGKIADLFSLQVTFKVLGFATFACLSVILVFFRREMSKERRVCV